MSGRVILSLSVLAALLFGTIGTASAHTMSIENGGARAWSPHSHSNACVRDLASDGFSVRADYYRVGSSTMWSVSETGGNGYGRCSDAGNTVSLIRACVVRPAFPDSCTGWVG